MKTIAVVVLMTALLVETGVLLQCCRRQGQVGDQLESLARKRDQFCTAYRGHMQLIQRDLSHEGTPDARTQTMHSFLTLASGQFFALCDIQSADILDEVERAHECYRVRADYGCVADVAGRIIAAMPQPSER